MNNEKYISLEKSFNQTKERINQLLPEIYSKSSGGCDAKYLNPYLEIPFHIETEKFVMLFTPKAGSSIIQKTFCQTDYSIFGKDFDWNGTEVRNELTNILMFSDEKFKYDKLSEFKLILDGNSKKDLIIVTRSPIYKFLSGLMMEINYELSASTILSYKVFGKFNGHNEISDNFESLGKGVISELISDFFGNRFMNERVPSSNHLTLYNETYSHILSNYNVDLSKVKIFDIDNHSSDLGALFGSYYPELENHESLKQFWTQRNLHDVLLESLRVMKEDSIGSMIWERIQSDIYSDYFYYQLFYRKFSKNIFIDNELGK